MSRNRDRISFQAIAIVLSFAIACYGCIFSTPESAVAAGLSPEEAALKEAGHVANGDGTGGENPVSPNDVDPLAFMVLDVQLTGEDSISLGWSDLGANFVYTMEYCDSLEEGSWSPCPPVEQWPTDATSWTYLLQLRYCGIGDCKSWIGEWGLWVGNWRECKPDGCNSAIEEWSGFGSRVSGLGNRRERPGGGEETSPKDAKARRRGGADRIDGIEGGYLRPFCL